MPAPAPKPAPVPFAAPVPGLGHGSATTIVPTEDPPLLQSTEEAIKALSIAAQQSVESCNAGTENNTRACIADALDVYAEGLAKLGPQLPARLRNIVNVVQTAARRVRAAKTNQGAVHALKIAISAIYKTISLLRADDPAVLKAESREGTFVAETLQVASIKLEKAAGL